MIVNPEIVTFAVAETSNTWLALPALTANALAPGPAIVMLAVGVIAPVVKVMTEHAGARANSMLSPELRFAALTASRRDPGPESLQLVTATGAAATGAAVTVPATVAADRPSATTSAARTEPRAAPGAPFGVSTDPLVP